MQTAEFNPLVSIIIPVYNGSNYMAEAIDSALAQTYRNIEIIVVNDGSADQGKTEEIALSYGNKIRYFKKENGGVSSALNRGIEEMRGEYFSWLSHDDKYEPQKIEIEISVLSKLENKETVVLCSGKAIDKDSKPLPKRKEKMPFASNAVIPWREAFSALFGCGSFNGCALLIHRHIFETAGKFDEDFRYIQDLYMWANIFLKQFPLFYIPDELVLSRVHGGQLTQTGRALFHEESTAMADKLLSELTEAGRAYSQDLLFAFANYNAKYNNKEAVKRVLNKGRLSLSKRFRIELQALYGSIRPLIRKIYYKVFFKVNTQ